MFKSVPRYDEIDDPVALVLAECDRFGIRTAMLGLGQEPAARAVREHPERFFGCWSIDPNDGMDGVRALAGAVENLGARAAAFFPAGTNPQVPINDKRGTRST